MGLPEGNPGTAGGGYKQILALMNRLPSPPVKEVSDLTASANVAISVRLPRSVHAALLAEAKAEGVSLNQLCPNRSPSCGRWSR
jgi:predicted HicB family RNase H-like nuclease